MKRFLIGLVAVAGLVASVLAVATSAASPTSGQTQPAGSILIENNYQLAPQDIAGGQPYTMAQQTLLSSITVTVTTIGGCDPGNLAPANNGVFSLPGKTRNSDPNSVASTGLLNPRCSWTVAASNPGNSCAVQIVADDDNNDDTDGDGTLREVGEDILALSVTGSLVLAGLNQGRLVVPSAPARGVTNIRVTLLRTDCVSTFAAGVSITVPGTGSNGVSAYAGTEFTVAYSSTQTGCAASGADTFVVGRTLSSTTPPAATVARKAGTTQPRLVSQTRAEAAKGASGTFCQYTVDVTPALPENTNLGRSSLAVNESIDGATATRVVNGILSGGADVLDPSPTKVYTVVAAYTAITVKIKVTTVFPSDEVFTTADRVDYTIGINAPCGGYLNLLPSGFGSQGDSASSQVFPGATLVYGEDLRPLTVGVTDTRTYRVDAYADARGSRVCSVTVSERNGPDRCSVVGGESQTQSYSAGATELAFEFNHTCDAVAAAGGDATDSGSGTPPAPPDIGLGEEDTDEATPVGPGDERFTG